MGNSNSYNNHNKYGFLLISFDKASYIAGEEVKGKIYANITETLETSGLFLNLLIQEHSRVGESIVNKTTYNEDFVVINNIEFNLLKAGHYTFPFSFQLPININSSCNYFDRDVSAYIKHVLTASFKGKDINLSTSELMLLNPNISESYISRINFIDKKEIETYFIKKKGESVLKVNINNFNYEINDSVKLEVIVDNSKCNLDVKEINISLYQKIKIKAEDKLYETLVLINNKKEKLLIVKY